MPATVTSSQQRRFMALRRGDDADSFEDLGAVVSAMRGLTSVAAEGAAKRSAEDAVAAPPIEVATKIHDDGRTTFDIKNLSADPPAQKLAQAAYDAPFQEFAQNATVRKVMEQLGRNRPAAQPEARAEEPPPRPDLQSTLRGASSAIGLPSPDRASVDQELRGPVGLYRANRDAGRGVWQSAISALAVKALPGAAEDSLRGRIADAQVKRRVEDLGRAYNNAGPVTALYEKDRNAFMDFVKFSHAQDERLTDNFMAANAKTSYIDLPEGTDPYAYMANLLGLEALPEPWKPFVAQTIAEQQRKRGRAAATEERAEKRDVRADEAATRAEASSVRAEKASERADTRLNLTLQKIAEATVEKPAKFSDSDYKVLSADDLLPQIDSETAHQPSLRRTIAKRLKWQSGEFDKLTAERKGLESEIRTLVPRLAAQQKRLDEAQGYDSGALTQVTQLSNREAAIRNRMVEIDALRKPMVEEIGKLQTKGRAIATKSETFTAPIEEGIRAHMAANGIKDRALAIQQLRDAGLLPKK